MIEYHFSNTWKDYSKLLRHYKLDVLLKAINALSNHIVRESRDKMTNGVLSMTCSPYAKESHKKVNMQVFVTGWGLIDLAFHAIKSSNDYRGTPDITLDELVFLCAADNSYMQEVEKGIIEDIKSSPEFLLYVWGFAGEQFKIETGNVFDNAARELYILFEISKKREDLDIADIVKRETGVSWQALCGTVLLVWFGFAQGLTFEQTRGFISWNEELSQEDFEHIVDRYSVTYQEIKNSELERQILYTRPYIRTQSKEIISVSCYLNLFLYEHCVLWAVRDHYKALGSQQFTADFGDLFEEYFRELLSVYLDKTAYEKIQEESKKRADWRISLCGYQFLVEQKSTILRLSAKQQHSDYSATKDYAAKTLMKAIKQLSETEQDMNQGQFIKIVLLYDDFVSNDIFDSVFSLPECRTKDDGMYWPVNIEVMERFIVLSKENPEMCKQIIEAKLERDQQKSPEGRSLKFFLDKQNYTENSYLKRKILQEYKDCAINFARMRLPHSGNAPKSSQKEA